MAYTKYSLTPGSNTAAPPDGAPEGMLPSAVNDTMRDMMAQIRDCGDGIRGGTYTMTAPVITGGSISGLSSLASTGVATFSAGSVSAPAITTTGDTNTGIYFPAADTIAFTEGGVESVRITSASNVGIGTSSPANKLHVVTNSTTTTAKGLTITNTAVSTGSGQAEIDFITDQVDGSTLSNKARITGSLESTQNDGYIAFSTLNSTMQERMRLNSQGALILQGGATNANGVGITFPATQSASTNANTLDDYEEGTWSPTVFIGATEVTSYHFQHGKYTKIGRMVYANCWFRVNVKGAATGSVSIQGLPFNLGNTNGDFTAGTIGYQDEMLLSSAPMYCYGVGNSAKVNLVYASATSSTDVSQANLNNGQIMMQISYSL
jgi:hypothetical protein